MSQFPDEQPQTDEHGFAPTKIVRVRTSRGGGAVRFFRVWMKPDDLEFPEQERRIVGEEAAEMRTRYALRKLRGEEMRGAVRLHVPPTGGIPQITNECGDVRGGVQNFLNPVENSLSPVRHGHARVGKKSPTYLTWKGMRARCSNPKSDRWKHYGGRGIKVCDRWRESFENFLADMGERPFGTTIERTDPDGDYEPGNCVWATRKTQARNKQNTRWLTVDGVTHSIAEWAEKSGNSPQVIAYRLRTGMSPHDAVWHLVGPRKNRAGSDRPTCGKCGCVMTPENATKLPELFLCDACATKDEKVRSFRWRCPECMAGGDIDVLHLDDGAAMEASIAGAIEEAHARSYTRDCPATRCVAHEIFTEPHNMRAGRAPFAEEQAGDKAAREYDEAKRMAAESKTVPIFEPVILSAEAIALHEHIAAEAMDFAIRES